MHPLWQAFLATRGIQSDTGRVSNFSTASETVSVTDFATDLSQFGVIRVDGNDARSFLQGQLSTNLDALTPDAGQFSSWSSPKGRVLTLLYVFLHEDGIHLVLPRALLAPLVKRLGMYVLRAKATLSDVSDDLAGVGLVGELAITELERLGLKVPTARWETSQHSGITLMRLHGTKPRLLCWGAPERLTEVAGALDKNLPWSDENDWALAAIQAGEPVIYPQTSDQFVAQMLHLDALGGIDFKKGCYTGQEIIARAHYRGRVKRHLVRAEITVPEHYAPGTEIFADSHIAGTLLDARAQSGGEQAALAVIQEEQLANPALVIGTQAAVFKIAEVYRNLSA